MLPTNFELIKRNEDIGGARSAASAEVRSAEGCGPRSARESVEGDADVGQWSDLSDPQGKTGRESSREQDEEVKGLLTRFEVLNNVRALLMGVGGVVGLIGALA
jgi:hypothetical protein